MAKKKQPKKKGMSTAGKVCAWIFGILATLVVVGVICYFAVPEFQTYVNNTWQDLTTKIQN